jgi:hypothetical protein
MKKIIILVIASRSKYYDEFMKIYWMKLIKYIEENNIDIKLYFIIGKNQNFDDLNIDKKYIFQSSYNDSLIPGIICKTLESMEKLRNTDFDYIFRTNLSSFIIINKLIEIGNNLPDNVYAGCIGKAKKIIFCSGSGFWLSKKYVNLLLDNKDKLKIDLLDDLVIGKFFSKIKKTKLNRYDLIDNKNKTTKVNFLLRKIKPNFHIRIKNKNRDLDILYFKVLTKIFYDSN